MTDFWLSKMKTYFKRIDFDKDGSITRSDFEGMAKRVIEQGNLKGDHATHLMTTLTNVWDMYLSVVGGGDKIDMDAFIKSMKTLVNEKDLKSTLEGPLPLFFKSVDANDDGFISQDEFRQFFLTLGLDGNLAPESFQAIDDNGDGQISLEEFRESGSDFFIEQNDESKPSKLFWGPLVA